MKATITWWDLDGSEQTIDSLRAYLRHEGVEPWTQVDRLVLKLWVADRENNYWGAIQIWDEDGPGDQPLPPNIAAQLIGYAPSHRASFDVEASVHGRGMPSRLDGHGPALEDATWPEAAPVGRAAAAAR